MQQPAAALRFYFVVDVGSHLMIVADQTTIKPAGRLVVIIVVNW